MAWKPVLAASYTRGLQRLLEQNFESTYYSITYKPTQLGFVLTHYLIILLQFSVWWIQENSKGLTM